MRADAAALKPWDDNFDVAVVMSTTCGYSARCKERVSRVCRSAEAAAARNATLRMPALPALLRALTTRSPPAAAAHPPPPNPPHPSLHQDMIGALEATGPAGYNKLRSSPGWDGGFWGMHYNRRQHQPAAGGTLGGPQQQQQQQQRQRIEIQISDSDDDRERVRD